MSLPIKRQTYSGIHGPTTADKVRLDKQKQPTLVTLAGERIVYGGNG